VTTFLTFRHDPFIFSGLRLHSAFLDKKGVIERIYREEKLSYDIDAITTIPPPPGINVGPP
jgi:hypothetical protein